MPPRSPLRVWRSHLTARFVLKVSVLSIGAAAVAVACVGFGSAWAHSHSPTLASSRALTPQPNEPLNLHQIASTDSIDPLSDIRLLATGETDCGAGWGAHRTAGRYEIALENSTSAGMDAYLRLADSHRIVAEWEALGSRSTRATRVNLAAGTYEVLCVPHDGAAISGPRITIVGALPRATAATPALHVLSAADLIPAGQAYDAWVRTQLPTFLRDTAALKTATSHHDLAATRQAWSVAHADYERLGGAYDAFGDVGDAINAVPGRDEVACKPSGLGFRALEACIWPLPAWPASEKIANQLVIDVQSLSTQLAQHDTDPKSVGLRAHEILEGTLKVPLDRDVDAASGTSLEVVLANTEGTLAQLDAVQHVVTDQVNLATIRASVVNVEHFLLSLRDSHGKFPRLESLRPSVRATLNAKVSQAVEDLAPIAAVTDPRRTTS